MSTFTPIFRDLLQTTRLFHQAGLLTEVNQVGVASYAIVSANSAQLVNTADQPLATLTDGLDQTATYLLDLRGRELQQTQPDGTSRPV